MMRYIFVLVCAFGLLFGRQAGDKSEAHAGEPPIQSYQLLGPPRLAGDLLRRETVMHMPNARIALSVGQQQMVGTIDIKGAENEDMRILATRGHQLLRYKRKINLSRTVSQIRINGKNSREVEHGALEGRTLFARLHGATWRHKLKGAAPNAKQREAMLELSPPEPDTPYYPRRAVSPGASWKVQAQGIAGLLGSQFQSIKGSARMTFVRIHRVRKRLCARIQVSLHIRARMSIGGGKSAGIRLRMRGTIDRALAIGLDLRMRLKGRIQLAGNIEQNGQSIGMRVSGPLTFRVRNVLRRQALLQPPRHQLQPPSRPPSKPPSTTPLPNPEPIPEEE